MTNIFRGAKMKERTKRRYTPMQNFVYNFNVFRKITNESEKKYEKKNGGIGEIYIPKPRIH